MQRILLVILACLAGYSQDAATTRARREAIAKTQAAIRQECAVAAKGDWQAWHAAVAPYRKELTKSFETSFKAPYPSKSNPALSLPLILWRSDQGHQVHANSVLSIANAGEDINAYIATDRFVPAAAAIAKWLRSKGVDLIFVPVPTNAEIYPEQVVPSDDVVPKDRNVLPHLRRKILRLLEEDVEVVDIYPGLMRMRDKDPECIYMAGDKHWRAEPQKFAAEQIAARLSRYPWVKQAKAKKPLFKEQKQPFEQSMGYYDYLPEAILAKAIEHRNGFYFNNVSAGDSPLEVTSPNSPVLVTGDSFVNHGYPFSGGLVGHLARSINQPVTVNQVAGNIVQTFQDMFRDPSLLEGKKVVVWIINGEPFGCNWMFPEKFKTP